MRGICIRKCCKPDLNMFFLNEHLNLMFCILWRGCKWSLFARALWVSARVFMCGSWGISNDFKHLECNFQFSVFVSLHLSMFTMIQTRICEWCGAEVEQGVHWWDFASGKARFLENWSICVCSEQSWSTACGFLSTAETQPCWYSLQ